MKPFVDIHDVTHVYARAEDGLPAVKSLNLKVNEGEFAAIVGPSGCGKSTLMKLATGLQFPREGTVIVDGKQVGAPVKLEDFQRRRRPTMAQEAKRPPVERPALVHARPPSAG